LYCPIECGFCDEVKVIDHCLEPGTVHLSFDDGPVEATDLVLDILKEENITASFWVLGNLVESNKNIIRRMFKEGHLVGGHSFTHAHFNGQVKQEFLKQELNLTKIKIEEALSDFNFKLEYHRPPYGELNSLVRKTVQQQGYKIILWNLDLLDWSRNGSLMQNVLTETMNLMNPSVSSFIALLHYIDKEMVCGLKAVIHRIKARGYQFVSAEECFHGSMNHRKPYFNFTLIRNDTACTHKPQTCMDGDHCSVNVTCCQPGHCCLAGFCSLINCGEGCVNGACSTCGDPMILFPPFNRLYTDQVSRYTESCPFPKEPNNKLTFTAYVLIGVSCLLVLIFGAELLKHELFLEKK